MTDFAEFHEPIEVYEAAVGEPARLIARLLSDKPIYKWERTAIASLIAGKLVPRTLPRGAPKRVNQYSIIAPYGWTKKGLARAAYEREIKFRKRAGISTYGQSAEIADQIAAESGIDPVEFANFLRRPKPQFKPRDFARGPVAQFQQWCDERRTKNT
jgi:hypothetical protein